MTTAKRETPRCVQLTEAGQSRFNDARRRYRQTIESIAADGNTPSVNTVKRAFRREPVFVDTLLRLWDYLRTCAEMRRETLGDLVEGQDYVFEAEPAALEVPTAPAPAGRRGWLSRQVPRPNRLFLGRRELLDRLHIALSAGPAAIVPDPQALTGLGGIGKTQTAIAYVYEHRRDYDGVFWAGAETIDDLNDSLAGFARELDLPDSASASRGEALQKIHDWFETRSGWLLVLDNADDLHALAPHFPRHHNGSLLLTTRGRNTTLWAAPVAVPTFGDDDGALLILRRAGVVSVGEGLEGVAPETRDHARRLSELLGGLPLALDQAGAFLAETQISVGEYLGRYEQAGLDLLDALADPQHKPVRVTFSLAVAQVTRRGRYGDAAVELLRLCAFLAPDSIPEAIAAAYPFAQDGVPVPAPDPAYCAEVIAMAAGYSLLRRDPAAGTLTIHRLVQAVIRDTLTLGEQEDWRARAVQAVADATPDFEFEDWALCEQLLPHWRVCADYIHRNDLVTGPAAHVLYQTGRYLRARALYAEAEPLLGRAVEIAQAFFGESHPTTAGYLDTLACLYRDLDRPDEARALHEQSVAVSEAVFGPDHAETAGKLHNLALLHAECGEYTAAEAFFVRALRIREKDLSPGHPGVATTLTQLGGVYRNQLRHSEAETCYRRALEIYERTLPPDHPDLAVGCNNLALLLASTERPAEAETLYRRALRINEVSRGPNHPETGTVLWGLALAQWRQGRRGDADRSFEQAIRIYRHNYSDDHARVVRLLRYYTEFKEDRPGSG